MKPAIPVATILLLAVTLNGHGLAQRVWSQRHVSTGAPARDLSAAVFDTRRQRLVLFGGSSTAHPFTPTADTFEWDGIKWTQRFPANSPPARMSHAMAYDESRREVVLFGGSSNSTTPLGDTWVWDGTDWTQRSPAASPAARTHHGMAYDKQRQQTVLFSGSNHRAWPGYQDTWEWDGLNWTRLAPATQPTPRDFHAMAYFPQRGATVMFGGQDRASNLIVNETWEWTGRTWTRIPTTVAPSKRASSTLTYNADRSVLVLFGGQFNTAFGDTWEWDGLRWTAIGLSRQPPPRLAGLAGYDPIRRAVVLHSGAQRLNQQPLNDTWEYSIDPMLTGPRPIRVGATHVFALSVSGDANRPYNLGTSLGTGPIQLGGRQLHLSPDALLSVSAGGVLPAVFAGYIGTLDAQGTSAASIRIPRFPQLVGVAIHSAFITVDFAAPLGIRSISNTFSATIAP